MAIARPPRDGLLGIDQITTRLREGPIRIAALTAGLPTAALAARPAPESWSVNENLAHLRASADVWGKYIGRIVAEEQPSFTSLNPRAHMRKTNYPSLDFASSFLWEYSVQFYGSKLARHEAVHLPQIEDVVRVVGS